jgi:hypothetical protein
MSRPFYRRCWWRCSRGCPAARKPLAINNLNNLVVTKLICHEIFRFDYFAAMKNPTDGYHKIEFEEDPPEIYLEAKQVEKNAAERQKTYSFPVRQHL